jgi:hypothetical protein
MNTMSSSAVTRNALKRGLIAGSISLVTYVFVVIVTTPNLPPMAALNAVVKVNGIIVFGLAIAIGVQFYMSSYAKSLGCSIQNKRKTVAGSSTSTALSSFFSFFSLVPLGCCGSWLLILSSLPSLFGSSLSVILIQYSKPLSYLGLAIVIGYTSIVAIKVKRKLEMIERDKAQKKVSVTR